ncbi:helix-turn-helix domain-containing protein [Butyrivibrio sp. WCD2001]|uniref:helix-turn-helix domain-containing protein n=1 Tax=Butyrivibrio sp. WCD2001 TaxID=1280681 RepID=UPI0004792A5B|nr:helix-turn-helix domain-containing protein [Butyrivibrio sp. WCD2001]
MQTNLKVIAWRFEEYYKKTRIPVWVFEQNNSLVFTNFTTSAILNIMEEMLQKARNFRISHSIEGSYLDLDNPYEMYYSFNSDGGKHQFYTVVIGPVMTVKPSGNVWPNLTFGENLFVEQKRILSNALPVINKEEFLLHITNFFNEVLEETPPDFSAHSEKFLNTAKKKSQSSDIAAFDAELSAEDARAYEEISRIEELFNVFVVNGSVYKLFSLFDDEKIMDVLFPDKTSYRDCGIRSIELLTIAKIASIESGTDKKVCQARFEKFVQELKVCKSYEKIVSVLRNGTLEFAKSSHEVNAHTSENYSPMTNKCIKRIIEKLPDKITLDDLASELHISAKYLSALFNKETGTSISDFMQNIRINEAKRLLRNTDLSYSEISNMLNFCSQSYFNNLFKKKEGMTPKEYREKRDELVMSSQ